MKVLVAGRAGQIARSLAELAAGRPELQLVAIGRPDLDLERPGGFAAAFDAVRPDVVINAAAYTAVDMAEDEPERAVQINAAAAGEIARQCRVAGARLIHISTDYVFDGAQSNDCAADAYAPDAPTHPLGVYGRSKLQGEGRVREETPDHIIVRTAWVYSAFGRNFVGTMMELARTQETVRVVADQRGNPSAAGDVALGLLRVVDQWRAGGTIGLGATYHLAGTGTASWAEFAGEIFAECRRQGLPSCEVQPIGSDEWPTRAPRPRNSALDCSGFERDFGYQMPEWRAALKAVIGRIATSE